MPTIRASSGIRQFTPRRLCITRPAVRRADDRVRFQDSHYPHNLTCIISVESLHQRGLERKTSDEKSLAIATDSRFDGRCRIGTSEETMRWQPSFRRCSVPCIPPFDCRSKQGHGGCALDAAENNGRLRRLECELPPRSTRHGGSFGRCRGFLLAGQIRCRRPF
jgi:hypothetical protein